MAKHSFDTTVELTGKTATFMEVPLDIPAIFDGAKKPPVKVKINDHLYRSTIAVYAGRYYLPINRDVKKATGVDAGDEITVEIERDTDERVVDAPADLKGALKEDKGARENFRPFRTHIRRNTWTGSRTRSARTPAGVGSPKRWSGYARAKLSVSPSMLDRWPIRPLFKH